MNFLFGKKLAPAGISEKKNGSQIQSHFLFRFILFFPGPIFFFSFSKILTVVIVFTHMLCVHWKKMYQSFWDTRTVWSQRKHVRYDGSAQDTRVTS